MTKSIKKVYDISANIDRVWQALVDPAIIDKWGGCPCEMNSEIGKDFELWNGDIYGKNIEVVKEKKLVQEWFGGDWAKPSIVTFRLKKDGSNTILELEQVDVPPQEYDDINDGWDDYYIGPMKKMLENNSG